MDWAAGDLAFFENSGCKNEPIFGSDDGNWFVFFVLFGADAEEDLVSLLHGAVTVANVALDAGDVIEVAQGAATFGDEIVLLHDVFAALAVDHAVDDAFEEQVFVLALRLVMLDQIVESLVDIQVIFAINHEVLGREAMLERVAATACFALCRLRTGGIECVDAVCFDLFFGGHAWTLADVWGDSGEQKPILLWDIGYFAGVLGAPASCYTFRLSASKAEFISLILVSARF